MGDGLVDDGAAVPADESDGIAGPADDAPWRPGFTGWQRFESATIIDEVGERGRPSDAADERWSREHDLAEPEPWVPQRPTRPERSSPPQPVGRPVADVDGQPNSSVVGSLVLGAIALAAVIAGALIAVIALRPAAVESALVVRAPIIPEQAEPLWSVEVGGAIDATAVGSVSVVMHSDEAGVMSAFDRTTGAELWSRSAIESDRGIDQLVVIDEVVAAQWRGPTGTTHVDAFQAETGDLLWSSAPGEAITSVASTPSGHVILRRERVDNQGALTVLDPTTGDSLAEPIVVSGVAVPGPFIGAVPADGRAVAWSLETLEPGTPAVDSFNVRSIAPLGDLTVGLDLDGRILAFDEDGIRTDEQFFTSDATGEFTSRAGLAGVVEAAGVGVISSGSSMGFEIIDGRIETIWQRIGRAFTPVETVIGPVSLMLGPTGPSGEINESIINPVTGDTIAITDDGVTREQPPVLGHNAYLVMPEIGDLDRSLTAFDYTGAPLWELPISSETRYAADGGLIVLVERTDDGTTLAVVG